MKIRGGIIAVEKLNEDKIGIVHFCGYEHEPTDADVENLEKKLNTDEEFGLVGRINKDVFLVVASPELVKLYAKEISMVKDEERFFTIKNPF